MKRRRLRGFAPRSVGALVALLCGLLPALVGARSTTSAAPDFATIDAYVEAQMRELRIPGLAMGIVQGDQIVHLKGFGQADPSGRAVTPQTPFMIGSVTKSMTALAMMQLVEAGKVDLDAPVQRYLPWFRVADEAASARMTVRHLLNQTSGLSKASGNAYQISRDMRDGALERQARSLGNANLAEPLGTFQYSNANSWPLGLIVQAVSGLSFDDYVEQHILAPLKMNNSFMSVDQARQHGLATGHRYVFGSAWPAGVEQSGHHRGVGPQGGAISSVEDMSHYLIAHLNAGQYAGTSIVSPDGMAELHRPAVPTGNGDVAYAMGLEVGQINGARALFHDGSMFSYHADIVLVPEDRWGIVLLENAYTVLDDLGPQRLHGIAIGVTGLVMGRPAPADGSNTVLVVIYSMILGIVGFQVWGMVHSVALLRRWSA